MATSFTLAHNLFPGHESNATQNPVKGHKLIRPLQGMGQCTNGQARSLRDELLVQGLALAQLPFRMARMVCVRCVIQVVAIEAVAPTKEPNAAAVAVTIVEFIIVPVLSCTALKQRSCQTRPLRHFMP